MNIQKDANNQFVYGKNDIFGLIIIFKYLLKNGSFSTFVTAFKELIGIYQTKSKRIPEKQLYEIMGLPNNWFDILNINC